MSGEDSAGTLPAAIGAGAEEEAAISMAVEAAAGEAGGTSASAAAAASGTEGETRAAAEPPAPARKPPLSRSEIVRFAERYAGEKTEILSGRGKPLLFLHDTAGDGYPEAVLVLIETEVPGTADLGYLSSYKRVFGNDPVSFGVSVLFFPQTDQGMGKPIVVPLGRRFSLQSFRTFGLIQGEERVICAELLFMDQEGTERDIVAFSGTTAPSRLSIHDSSAGPPIFDDIDGDSVLDIVVPRQGFEEGTGYETYLTWYRWNRGSFTENRSVNIVRSLNRFLDTCSRLLVEGEWEAFCATAMDPQAVADFRRKGDSYFTIAMRCFTLTGVPEGAPFEAPFMPSQPPSEVFFPVLFENPFNIGKGLPAIVPLSARFSTQEKGDYLYSLRVVLAANPFGKRQYRFDPH